jgi:hypothetical protein
MSSKLFPSKGCCTAAFYLAIGLHVTISVFDDMQLIGISYEKMVLIIPEVK